MSLDSDDPRPPYLQIAGALRAAIRSQQFAPGERLPSGAELAKTYGVARMTVHQAQKLLKDEGLLITRQGTGVFVRERVREPVPEEPSAVDREKLAELFRNAQAILLDFDGPVCSVFAGRHPLDITSSLRPLLPDHGAGLPGDAGPHEALLYTLRFPPEISRQVEAALSRAEVDAISSATPTRGAAEFIEATGAARPLALVSNNTAEAVRRYLNEHDLTRHVWHIEGRDAEDPSRMKPSPYLLKRAAHALDVDPSRCLAIGDSTSDVEAAKSAGMPCIGYANKPGKHERLAAAEAELIITDLALLP
jgi:HAD superfamily hydrolase (TIGR01509 family)